MGAELDAVNVQRKTSGEHGGVEEDRGRKETMVERSETNSGVRQDERTIDFKPFCVLQRLFHCQRPKRKGKREEVG